MIHPLAPGDGAEPKRIQRRRTKGWRMPEGAVYVGRPTKWGNPWTPADFTWAKGTAAQVCVEKYRRDWVNRMTIGGADLRRNIEQLRGHDLACWCPLDQPCHADVLLKLANEVKR